MADYCGIVRQVMGHGHGDDHVKGMVGEGEIQRVANDTRIVGREFRKNWIEVEIRNPPVPTSSGGPVRQRPTERAVARSQIQHGERAAFFRPEELRQPDPKGAVEVSDAIDPCE